jgi:hypothetical protein
MATATKRKYEETIDEIMDGITFAFCHLPFAFCLSLAAALCSLW